MAALRSSRQMISKINIKEININLSCERPRAIAADVTIHGFSLIFKKFFEVVIETLWFFKASPEKFCPNETQPVARAKHGQPGRCTANPTEALPSAQKTETRPGPDRDTAKQKAGTHPKAKTETQQTHRAKTLQTSRAK